MNGRDWSREQRRDRGDETDRGRRQVSPDRGRRGSRDPVADRSDQERYDNRRDRYTRSYERYGSRDRLERPSDRPGEERDRFYDENRDRYIRSYDQSGDDPGRYGRSYDRDYEDRDRYGSPYDRSPERGDRYYRNQDWQADLDDFGEDYHYGLGRGYGRRYSQGYRTAGVQSDHEEYDRGQGRRYRTAGMQSDYDPGSRGGYELERGSDRREHTRRPPGRGFAREGYSRRPAGRGFDLDYYDDDETYSAGYVGYESEGAFYQDLDEPYSREYWEYGTKGEGEFSGIGPANYRRPDGSIREDACQRLTRHGQIDASDIEIAVENGQLTLSGRVPNRAMKRGAEDALESISGVREIDNRLKVEHSRNR